MKKISVKMIGSLLLVVTALLANHVSVRSENHSDCYITTYLGGLPDYCKPPQLELHLLPSVARESDKDDFAKADMYTIFVDIVILSLGYLSIRQAKK